MMFFPWGMRFAGFWFLLIPAAVFITLGVFRLLSFYSRRGQPKDRGRSRMPLQDEILQLALREGGLLTVTDVVAHTGLSFKKAEKALKEMVDFSRVHMRVSDSGTVVYDFVEIRLKDKERAKTLGQMGI
jgi:predicted transcriptional regulator